MDGRFWSLPSENLRAPRRMDERRSGTIASIRPSTGSAAAGYNERLVSADRLRVSEEILINVTPRETRVGVVENGMLQEVHVERASRRGYVGNIYKGRVQRVMPGMQAAFVEIGLGRAAFLHASDIVRPALPEGAEGNGHGNGHTPSISELVHEGQEIVVQVVKDPIGSKGARLSAHLSIPSRYLVLLPYAHTMGISARIEDEAERTRLREVMGSLVGENPLGYIVRTNAEGQSAESLAFDVTYLG